MNVLWLKYAIEVAKTGSISKAADNLYMGQPNLSRAIRELEESLGIAIFERTTKGIVVTEKGKEFLKHSETILKQIDELENIYVNEKQTKQKFSISVPRASYISSAFAEFSNKISYTKNYDVFYNETNSIDTIENVIKDEYKLGIIRFKEEDDKFVKNLLTQKSLHYDLISEFNYVVIMNKDSLLAKNNKITAKDLEKYIEITHSDDNIQTLSPALIRKVQAAEETENRIYVFERASQFELLQANASTYMFVSPIPPCLLGAYNLVQKEYEDKETIYKDVLIYKKDYILTELDKEFITILCNNKRKFL